MAQSGFPWGLVVYIVFALVTTVAIVIFTEAHRRIPVQYAKSVFRGGRMYRQSGSTHIPLRVNAAGMMPIIFASSMVIFPGVVASYFAAPSGAPLNFANQSSISLALIRRCHWAWSTGFLSFCSSSVFPSFTRW